MYELYPYFTNDGTVGLFSPQFDDIYHSTYGALTESWQKFILPAHLSEYIQWHQKVKILDICYGIGYNTKTALQVFINEVQKNSKKNKIKNLKNKKISHEINNNIAAIDTDNNLGVFHDQNNENYKKEILIDAVDLDKNLIILSPFITNGIKSNLFFNKKYLRKHLDDLNERNKLKQVYKINKSRFKFPKKKFRLSNEVSIILLNKIFENNFELFDEAILLSILNSKKYSPFYSQFTLNYAKFYQNQTSNYTNKSNKSPFLHNIYYKYLSKSYKNAKNVLKNHKIDLNFYRDDARRFIQGATNTYNYIFLDAFTPSKCPALWTQEFFKELSNRLEHDGMILTYSTSAAIRNAFLQNGLYVGKIYDKQFSKFIGTVAVKNPSLLEYPLDEKDLKLIQSKAGICFRDENLNLDNITIMQNRNNELQISDLVPSSKILEANGGRRAMNSVCAEQDGVTNAK